MDHDGYRLLSTDLVTPEALYIMVNTCSGNWLLPLQPALTQTNVSYHQWEAVCGIYLREMWLQCLMSRHISLGKKFNHIIK